jgi:hypothetical protein
MRPESSGPLGRAVRLPQMARPHIRDGKTRNAKRNLSLTPRVRAMLEGRQKQQTSVWVFTDETGTRPLSRFTLRDQHDVARQSLKLPEEFVIYCLRHTFGTRLGESRADAFTIMKVMGHKQRDGLSAVCAPDARDPATGVRAAGRTEPEGSCQAFCSAAFDVQRCGSSRFAKQNEMEEPQG